MSIDIKEVTKSECYLVNGKEIYKDADGKWIARQELTPAEFTAFSLYKAARAHESRNN